MIELDLKSIDVTGALSLKAGLTGEISVSDGKEIYKENGITSYEMLDDLPKLNGETIIGDVAEKDPTVPLWAKTANKPVYTAEEVGVTAISIEDLQTLWDNL